MAVIDNAGYVTLPRARPKTPAGRYAVLSKSGNGVSLNLEYSIQIGTTAELVLDYGWAPGAVDFERGEFDAIVVDEGRVVVAVEAKARVTGPDSLEKLVKTWLRLQDGREQEWASNAGRKLRELTALCREGPILVWLLANGARWSVWAQATAGGLALLRGPSPARPLTNPNHTEELIWEYRPYEPTWHRQGTAAHSGACSWHGPVSCQQFAG